MIVSEAVDVFTGVPLTSVVTVITYVPGHVPLRMGNGNEMVLEVFAGKVKGGVVKMSDFVLPHLLGCKGPLSENLTTTVCAVVAQDITCPVTVTVPPKCIVDGEILSNTPQTTCSAKAAEVLPPKFASPL